MGTALSFLVAGRSGLVKSGVVEIDILLIHLLLNLAQTLAKALIMDDLTLTQEADHIVHIRVIRQAQDIVIGLTGLLLGGQVLSQVGNNIAGRRDGSSASGEAGSGGGVDAGGVVHKVGGEIGVGLYLFIGQIAGQLVHDSGNHLKVRQLLGTCRGGAMEGRVPNPCGARVWVVKQRRHPECTKSQLHEIAAGNILTDLN